MPAAWQVASSPRMARRISPQCERASASSKTRDRHQRRQREVVETELGADQRRQPVDALLAAGVLPEDQHQPLHDHRAGQHRQREVRALSGAAWAGRSITASSTAITIGGRHAPPAVEAEAGVHEAGRVGADADEQAVAEVLAAGEARHEIPGDGPDAVDHADGEHADQVVARRTPAAAPPSGQQRPAHRRGRPAC